MLGAKLPGDNSNEERPSRRDFLLGIAVASAVALPVLSAPARAAVSMLRTGLDPDLLETESEIIPAGKAAVAVARAGRWKGRGGGGKGRGGKHHGGGGKHHGGGGKPMVAVASRPRWQTPWWQNSWEVMAMDITAIDTVMVAVGGMIAGTPGAASVGC